MTGRSRRFPPTPHAGRHSHRPRIPSRPPGLRSPNIRACDTYRPPGPRSTKIPNSDYYRPTYDQRRAQEDSQAMSPSTPSRLARSRRGFAGGQHDRRHQSPSPCQRSDSVERSQRLMSTMRTLPPDHPLREELRQLKNVRWKRKLEWVRLARRLGPDWELPDCQGRLQFRLEEEKADQRLCDLAVMVALEERGLLDSDPIFGTQKTRHRVAPDHHRTPSPLPNLEYRHPAKRYGQSNAANLYSKRKSDSMITAWMQDAGNQAALANMKPPVPLFISEDDSELTCQGDVSLNDHGDLEADEQEQGNGRSGNEKLTLGSHSLTPSRRPTLCLASSVDSKAASRALSSSSQTKEMNPSPTLGLKIDIRLPKKGPQPQTGYPKMEVDEADTANHRVTVKLPAPPIMSVPDVPEVEMTDQTHDLLPGVPWLSRKAATSKASAKSESPVRDVMHIDLSTPEPDVRAESTVNQSDEFHTVSDGNVSVNIPAPKAPLQPGFTASAMATATNEQHFDLAGLLRSCKAARVNVGAQLQGQGGEREQAGEKGQGDEHGYNGAEARSFRGDIDYKMLRDVLQGRK